MNTTTQASRFIPITNPDLRFMGRIDRTPADHQTWAFPYTQVSFRCTGTSIGVRLVKHSEPIVLIGIPEAKVKALVAGYAGLDLVAEAKSGGTAHEVDIISGATVTVMVTDSPTPRS